VCQASIVKGSHIKAALPTTSGKLEVFEQTTGVAHAIASSGGKPKPSYTDGNAKIVAAESNAGKSLSDTWPSNRTLWRELELSICLRIGSYNQPSRPASANTKSG
tara:strand:- start:175 stop:489 length:315 start_codon:yes stop_codon:yes gene_type:complete